ncbi:minichromosome maintenance protein MCM [Methanofollis formosanus]|uniref:DNA helicase n=1 Tax=Methanofollis formosanus TaxID=299308 RepID=A0A8G1A0K0_9EURY|nr:minichromosome maintenance protein MCM [Methanofollis formosanus]QYZ78473.1 minichromosome maintenance protein MCM [Methanofollis formosanus]
MADEITDVVGEWVAFLSRYCKREVAEVEREFPFKRSVYIDYQTLQASGASGLRLADEVIEKPGKAIGDIRDALRQMTVIDEEKVRKVNIRFHHIERVTGIRDIRAFHINRFVSVQGIIRKTTDVRPRIIEAFFQCPGCGTETRIRQGLGQFEEPDECANPECRRKKLKMIPARSRFVDSQKVRVQESPEGLRGGERPQTLDVEVADDLTGAIAPGDRVVLNGVLRSKQRVNYGTKSTLFDLYLECSSVESPEKEFEEVNISEEDEATIRALSEDPELYQKITASIAPSIYGNTEVKEAIALQLFGGVAKDLPDGSRLRGDIHMLLVGDPGIAKSQMLRYVVKLSPRGIYTSGKSSTSAGLTATAVKDDFGDGSWTLEAGALVLADMGVAAVDEMDKMAKEDRSALHEAMEQQTISVAKAGITATLRSRCALLGAANPKLGRFDAYAPIAEQINMPPSLLSRFDLIFIMTDKPDEKRDSAIANHIVSAHRVGELIMQQQTGPVSPDHAELLAAESVTVDPPIPPDVLRKYVAYSKRYITPLITDEAREILIAYYLKLRHLADENKPVPVTARQLEALVRLGEASARIRLSRTVEPADAERVVKIVDLCLRQVAYDAETGTLDIDKWASGITKKKRDLIRTIKDTIKELSGEDGTARTAEVIEALAREGFDREDVEEQLEKMFRFGQAMQPRRGIVRLI